MQIGEPRLNALLELDDRKRSARIEILLALLLAVELGPHIAQLADIEEAGNLARDAWLLANGRLLAKGIAAR